MVKIDKIKVIVNGPDWPIMLEWLEAARLQKNREMENHIEPKDLYKSQGYIQALKDIMAIKERINAKSA